MARKRHEPVKAVESESESSGEEDDEVGLGESESEPEKSPTPTRLKSQSQSFASPPPQNPPPSSSGSETESDSDESDSTFKPPPTKPTDAAKISSSGARNTESKPNAPEPVKPIKSSDRKRYVEEDTPTKDAKKAKKTEEPETSEKKSNLFQRVWSEEDEIALLRGMIDYSKKKKLDPILDLNDFHDFIKKNLHVDVSRSQLQDKIKRLKKKYGNNKSKEKEGKQRSFSKSHEQKAYDLSNEIWDGKVVGNDSVAKNKNVELKRVNWSSVGLSVEERMLMYGREIYQVGSVVEGEKEDWEKLGVEELEIYLNQLEIRIAQTKLVLNAMRRKACS